MKIYNYLACLIFAFLLISCVPEINKVKPGMTEAEVKEILGEPNKNTIESNTLTTPDGKELTFSKGSWTYDEQGEIFFRNGKVEKVEVE
jgi:hypothetical protein